MNLEENIKNEEEVKNQMIDGKKRVVTEKLPEKFAKKIAEKLVLKKKRLQAFVQVSLQIANANEKQQEILRDLKSAGASISSVIQDSFKRLKLNKRPEYNWRFDGKENFIGVYNPPKPKKEEPKK